MSMALLVKEINRKTNASEANTTSKIIKEITDPPKKELETLAVTGAVKWFNDTKKYGFVTSTELGEDVLIHVAILKAFGYATISEGAQVTCEAIQSHRGLQALRILAIDESTALYTSHNPRTRARANVVPTSEWVLATVKWFNRLRGFGFLTLGQDTPDIFVHMETLRNSGILCIQPDEEIMVRYGETANGLMATEVRCPE